MCLIPGLLLQVVFANFCFRDRHPQKSSPVYILYGDWPSDLDVPFRAILSHRRRGSGFADLAEARRGKVKGCWSCSASSVMARGLVHHHVLHTLQAPREPQKTQTHLTVVRALKLCSHGAGGANLFAGGTSSLAPRLAGAMHSLEQGVLSPPPQAMLGHSTSYRAQLLPAAVPVPNPAQPRGFMSKLIWSRSMLVALQ